MRAKKGGNNTPLDAQHLSKMTGKERKKTTQQFALEAVISADPDATVPTTSDNHHAVAGDLPRASFFFFKLYKNYLIFTTSL